MIRTGWMRAASSSPVPARSVKGTVQGQAGGGQPHPALRLQGQLKGQYRDRLDAGSLIQPCACKVS